MLQIAAQILLFKATWTACAYGAANGLAWPGLLMGAITIALHLFLTQPRQPQIFFILATACLGLVAETLLIQSEFITYEASWLRQSIAPSWIIMLWMAFATLYAGALTWLSRRPMLAAILGAAGGALSYYSANQIGALTLAAPQSMSLATATITWAIATPMLSILHDKLTRAERPT